MANTAGPLLPALPRQLDLSGLDGFRELGLIAKGEPQALPVGFPTLFNVDFAWTGAQYRDKTDFIYCLTEADRAEIRSALEAFKEFELDGDLVSRDKFPLPKLGPKLASISHDMHNGRGFAVIRGLNPSHFAVEDLTTIWLGMQAYVADQPGRQDHKGNILVHIIADKSTPISSGHHRHSTSAISFHNEEAGDITSWLTRSTASSGGKCIIASAYTVYNILAAHRPDLVRTLAKRDWPFAIPHFQCRPIIFHHDSRLIMNFGRTPLIGSATHPRPAHLPKITPRQLEALGAIEAIARATQLEIQTQAGDMHFINNMAILHRREGFVNGSKSRDTRHLVRMRLRSSQLGWSIPQDLRDEWDRAFDERSPRTWHLEPMPGGTFPLRKYTN